MLVHYTPFAEAARVQALVDRLFDSNPRGEVNVAAFSPAFDVVESDDKIELSADLPGLSDGEVDIQVDGGVLTIKGERKLERAKAAEGNSLYRRYERVSGAFARSFRLPPTIDAAAIAASLKAGVLTLTLPKRAEAQPRQIKIAVAS